MSNKITTKLINAATACLLLMYFAFVPACGIAEAESLPPLLFRNISFGSVGEDVRSLQRYLNENGYPVALSGPGSYGSETLFFGYATRTALAKFQVAHGLPGTGYAGNSTKTLFNNLRSARASQDAYSILSARIEALKAQIASLQQLLNYYQPESGAPFISSIRVYDGGDEGYIDVGDYISITFNEPIDPESVNRNLDEGDYVRGIDYWETGGVSVSSAGKVTIKGIASFDMGSVEDSGKFTSKLALSSTGKILTITLTSGSDIEIRNENFTNARQAGGIIEDEYGNSVLANVKINNLKGTFGRENGNDDDSPYISSIRVYDGGD
ncbi:MAG TPA: peptidoglycan-binding domain-containing protein, partial [Candidatus Paceibacterota bacterium]|nr:peptidoglycan-binding domain-containing protein [Candidatus Pacearchaeota archaeon]HRZ51368.1 peptidoglycan-binding domain-containing protein [Candidatus Paceibacterota bacterium]